MKIIISPAKKMVVSDSMVWKEIPVFLRQAEELKEYIKTLTLSEAKELWKCSDRLAELNYGRFRKMDLRRNQSPAILSYEGIQYQYMAPEVMDADSLDYIQVHLRILSGFYGLLKPFDGIVPYRLEMQAKARVGGSSDLYEYWGSKIYDALISEGDHTIINLASKEYSVCIEKSLKPGDRFITAVFGEEKNGKVIQKGTQAKIARGEMVRYLAASGIDGPDGMKDFDRLGYCYREDLSTEDKYVYIRQETV